MHYWTRTPIGYIKLTISQHELTHLSLLESPTASENTFGNDSLGIIDQIHDYFSNPMTSFSVPIRLLGTPFQQHVWRALTLIPLGTTRTYGQLAKQLHSSPRAVGQACRRNPIPIIIPCHRVIAATHLGGYAGAQAGDYLSIKSWLLNHEQALNI